MFVCVDMDNLQFIHKHREHEVVSGLAYLEACDRSTTVDSTECDHFLKNMTPLDLRILYRNTTGMDITGTDDIVVREMLATIVDNHIQERRVVLAELDTQIEVVVDDLEKGIPWMYSLGARKPAKQEQLFQLSCKPLDPTSAMLAAQRAPQQRSQRSAPKPRATPTAAPRPAPVRKARAYNVRPTIWAVADAMWQAAGSPRDKIMVLELRKKMMAELEEKHSVKRTSSSNELGNWMKERLA